jgi:hypothetical protein
MDCPVCKYPNPSGATHCGMCYEVFNRSAAQSYLHAAKRERLMKDDPPSEPEAVIKTQHVVEEMRSTVSVVDWHGLMDRIVLVFKKSRKGLAIAAGLVGVWIVVSILFSAGLWYHLLGKKFVYAFSDKTPVQYLVGMKTGVKSWSERHGRLDTPLERFKVDEIGNVLLEKKKTTAKNKGTIVLVHTKEWIQITDDAGGAMSHTISKSHPSLADARLVLNKKGVLTERHYALSPRLAKCVPFLSPRFPTGRLHRGRQWSEDVEWLDVYNDWQIRWKGTLHWTLGELVPCGGNTCAQLTYSAELEPRLRGGPRWANGMVHRVDATATTGEGEAIFDAGHKRLMSNTFSYDGVLHFPIDNLAHIPHELRIGRRIKGPGEIILRFENKIDLTKN